MMAVGSVAVMGRWFPALGWVTTGGTVTEGGGRLGGVGGVLLLLP